MISLKATIRHGAYYKQIQATAESISACLLELSKLNNYVTKPDRNDNSRKLVKELEESGVGGMGWVEYEVVKAPPKNIGGSLFPSSSPEILRPLAFGKGALQVFPNEELDTHELFFIQGEKKILLASHPNGYSCHCLAERMIAKNQAKIGDQALYIVRCGGVASLAAIHQAMVSTEMGAY